MIIQKNLTVARTILRNLGPQDRSWSQDQVALRLFFEGRVIMVSGGTAMEAMMKLSRAQQVAGIGPDVSSRIRECCMRLGVETAATPSPPNDRGRPSF